MRRNDENLTLDLLYFSVRFLGQLVDTRRNGRSKSNLRRSPSMIWFGIAAIGVSSEAFVAEVIPTMRRFWRRSGVKRSDPKVKTRILQ